MAAVKRGQIRSDPHFRAENENVDLTPDLTPIH
jgi:hypothetical protein